MSYIGRGTDSISNVEVLDNLTFNGSASYTLQKSSVNFVPSSANNLLISISGVVQQGNFSVSGSTITFDTTVSGSDTCDWILHYGTGLITIPADGTVSLDKLSATGTKSSSTFLRGDNSFATVPTGVSLVDMQVITTTSTYTPTSGTQFVKVYCVGAGGGGGGSEATTSNGQVRGGGGGGGGTAIRTYNSTELGATASITIGSGGTGGTGFADGTDGGNTTFNPAGTGVTLTGNGGTKGYGVKRGSDFSGASGNGGTATNGQLNIRGRNLFYEQSGGYGNVNGSEGTDYFFFRFNRNGGGSFLSSDGEVVKKLRSASGGSASTTNGANGDNGSGGNGSFISHQTTTANGGSGGDGMVVIEEYA